MWQLVTAVIVVTFSTMFSGNAHHDNNTDGDVVIRGIFPRSLYCRYVVPELAKIFCVRDALVRTTILRHFHRYAAMFDQTTLTRVILPQVCSDSFFCIY